MSVDGDSTNGGYTMMSSRERVICGSLCLCLALAVLSAVAMVYLMVIIYIPSQREMTSGIGELSVMCTTVERRKIHGDIEACRWASCSEWCLSKGGGDCTQLIVNVRANGTDVELEGCTEATEKECVSLDMEALDTKNCKEDHECTELSQMFKCEDGLCHNISSVYSCFFDDADADWPPISCVRKRNCIELTGMYHCQRGMCRLVHRWSCERRCTDIPLRERNVVLLAGDTIVSAKCRTGRNSRNGETLWKSSEHVGKTLVASCTTVDAVKDDGIVSAQDCINGSVIPSALLDRDGREGLNYTELVTAFTRHGHSHRLDSHGTYIPFDIDVSIYNASKLMINTQGCVNTLQEECEAFYKLYGVDGRNQTSPSRYPCFYAPTSPQFVVARFDLGKTQQVFLMFFVVPASLLILSCGVLFLCSRILNIDNTGHMVVRKFGADEWDDDLGGGGMDMPPTKMMRTKSTRGSVRRKTSATDFGVPTDDL